MSIALLRLSCRPLVIPNLRWCLLSLLLLWSGAGQGQTTTTGPTSVTATWHWPTDQSPRLTINLSDGLSDKQRVVIDGGFTTVSQLTLKLPINPDDEKRAATLPPLYDLRCSVKFDAWEETYDVARFEEQPKIALFTNFTQYGDFCLKAELNSEALIARIGPQGGIIIADLAVKQTSAEEASKIKEWLIQQQSGVMQSLFSHMLGELTLSQNTTVRVVVPPLPQKPQDQKKANKPSSKFGYRQLSNSSSDPSSAKFSEPHPSMKQAHAGVRHE